MNIRDSWPHISTPPAKPVQWKCERIGAIKIRNAYRTKARTWFEARTSAMKHFRCGPGEVVVVPA